MSGNDNGMNSSFDDKYVFQDSDGPLPSPSVGYRSNLNKRHFSGYSTSSSKAGDDFEDASSMGKTPMLHQDSSSFAPSAFTQVNLKSSNIENRDLKFAEDDEGDEGLDDLGELRGNKPEHLQRNKTTFQRHRWGTQRKKDGRP